MISEDDTNAAALNERFQRITQTDCFDQWRILMDEQTLGMNTDILRIVPAPNKPTNTDMKWQEEYLRVTVEWDELNREKEDTVAEFDIVACTAGDGCISMRRMLFIAKILQDHCLRPLIYNVSAESHVMIDNVIYLDLFQQCLAGYTAVSFLDDLHHIESMHDDGHNAMECECNGTDKECADGLIRKYRRRERGDDEDDSKMEQELTPFEQYMNGLDESERLIMETSVKMHEALCHRHEAQQEIDEKDGDEEQFKVRSLTWWKQRAPKDAATNKFVNEVMENKGDREERAAGRMDELDDVMLNSMLTEGAHARLVGLTNFSRFNGKSVELIEYIQAKNRWKVALLDADSLIKDKKYLGVKPDNLDPTTAGMNRADCAKFIECLSENQYDSETLLYDLDGADSENRSSASNLFGMMKASKFLLKIVRKHLARDGHDDDELPNFSFGSTLWDHWMYFEGTESFNTAKYSNLKEECTMNKIHSISVARFNRILTKAVLLRESKKGRNIRSRDIGRTNTECAIPPNLPLSISHIVALTMYCNETKLQYLYKKFGCRQSSEEQTVEDLKELNSEIGHWYRLLMEATRFFGSPVKSGNVFYTGLNVKLSFSTFAPVWLSPFSTTVDKDVANRFSDGTGIILQLEPTGGSDDCYFDVEWLSNYSFEKERLFGFACNLQICDIKYYHHGKFPNNERYLTALSLFSGLFEGHFIRHLLRKRKGRRKAEKVLLDLIAVYKEMNNIPNDNNDADRRAVPLYIQQIFHSLMREFKRKDLQIIIPSEFEKLCDGLKAELFSFKDDEIHNGRLPIVSFPFFRSLYPMEDIEVTQEFMWIMDEDMMRELKDSPPGEGLQSEKFLYRFAGLGNASIVFDIKRKSGDSKKATFGITIKDSSIDLLDGTYSVFVDEMNWYVNGGALSRMRTGSSQGSRDGFYAFQDELINNKEWMTVHISLQLWKAEVEARSDERRPSSLHDVPMGFLPPNMQ